MMMIMMMRCLSSLRVRAKPRHLPYIYIYIHIISIELFQNYTWIMVQYIYIICIYTMMIRSILLGKYLSKL